MIALLSIFGYFVIGVLGLWVFLQLNKRRKWFHKDEDDDVLWGAVIILWPLIGIVLAITWVFHIVNKMVRNNLPE